jgi:hypothetical protein
MTVDNNHNNTHKATTTTMTVFTTVNNSNNTEMQHNEPWNLCDNSKNNSNLAGACSTSSTIAAMTNHVTTQSATQSKAKRL